MKSKIKVLDLFSGAGGFSSGFQNAGFDIKGAIEINEIYAKTHENNFEHCKTICGDIRDWSPKKFAGETKINAGDIDVIIGGPPCQTFSSIGTPKINSIGGANHSGNHRTYLYKNYFDYIRYYQPKVFVMENVPTLKTKDKGQLFQKILNTIKELKFTAFPFILNAVNYGVPQIRKRLFIVGFQNSTTDYSGPVMTHFGPREESEQNRTLKRYSTVKDAFDDLPIIFDGIRENYMQYSKTKPISEYQKLLRNDSKSLPNNICRVSNERAKKVFEHMKQGDKYMDLPPEVRSILPFREDIFHDRLKRLKLDEPSWTVLAHIGMDGYMYIHPTEVRTISVREAARLQSFRDNFEFVGNMREQYIQVGNSVPPLLAEAIAKSLKPHLSL